MTKPVEGWLLILCLLLLIGQPISLGITASASLGRLAILGLPAILILLARLVVTSVGVAAGLALLGQRPAGVALTKFALMLSAATDLFVYSTPYVPHNRAPGETPLYVVASLAFYCGWLIYLYRSDQVRDLA